MAEPSESERRQISAEYRIDIPEPQAKRYQQRYQQRSEQAVNAHHPVVDLPYDNGGARQTLDIFAPCKNRLSPVVVFIHGGYWRANSKESRRFPATELLPRNTAWVPINYRLAPDFSLDEIVADVRQAIAWIYHNGAQYGCDPERIVVCGNSAGGQLVGMLAIDGWQQALNLPKNVIKGGCTLSGLFDLAPLRQADPNEWLNMDADMAHRNSPARFVAAGMPPLVITCGGQESAAFRQQSSQFVSQCRSVGVAVDYFEMAEDNHFSIIGQLASPNSRLFQALMGLVQNASEAGHC